MLTSRMLEIADAHQNGEPIAQIADRFGITVGSVKTKIEKVGRHKRAKLNPLGLPSRKATWDLENIKQGIDRYIGEFGKLPSAQDFDEVSYLPSARQIQRAYGGVVRLRKTLGFGDQDFTKGDLRRRIAVAANKRGVTAEDAFEPLLIEKFGEPFVHTQKRYYKGSKCRYDFLVYAKDITFGIDIFTTDRVQYIDKNIRHKIARYKNAPSNLLIYFVLVGKDFNAKDLEKSRSSIAELKKYPNMVLLHESEFIKLIDDFDTLKSSDGLVSLESLEN